MSERLDPCLFHRPRSGEEVRRDSDCRWPTVELYADHFSHDTPDEVWLEEIGRRGWIALTHDSRIRYKPTERDAVMRHGLALLVIVGKAPFAELVHAFMATLPRIDRFSTATIRRSSPRSIVRRRARSRGTVLRQDGSSCGVRVDLCIRPEIADRTANLPLRGIP